MEMPGDDDDDDDGNRRAPGGKSGGSRSRTLPHPSPFPHPPLSLVFARFGMDLTTTATVPPAVTYQRKKRNARTHEKESGLFRPTLLTPPSHRQQTSKYCQDLLLLARSRSPPRSNSFASPLHFSLPPSRVRTERKMAEHKEGLRPLLPHSNTPLFL
ncbi:unnamed protein product [Ixodes hexagonus]